MSNLVTYSSEDEEEIQEEKIVKKTIPDVNYDDVQMEMSDDGHSDESSSDESVKTSAEKNLFSSKEDYLAYKKQFSNTTDSSNGQKISQGNTPEEIGAKSEHQKVKNPTKGAEKTSQESKVIKQQTPDKSDSGSEQKRRRNDRSRSKSHEKKREERKRDSHHSHHHRRKRSRSRSRSRDKDRKARHDRRHRSRSSSRERSRRDSRDNDNGRDRQELRNRKLYSLGLTESDRPKNAMPTGSNQARAIKAHLEHVKAVTGVELPKYYNPTAINPLKYAEQIKKRQLLWGSKKPDDPQQPTEAVKEPQKPVIVEQNHFSPLGQAAGGSSYNKWETTNFGNSKANEKFRRLMGIKGNSDIEKVAEAPKVDSKQIFGQLEQEYERARAITHTQRGLGLGFSSLGASTLQPSQPAGPAPGINFVKK